MAHHTHFVGGIQNGSVATDQYAKQMDDNAKVAKCNASRS